MTRFFILISFFSLSNVFCLPAKATLAVVGIAKNCESRIYNAFNFIKKIRSQFPESKIFIYENDSSDATPLLLNQMAEKTPGMTVLSEKSPPEEFGDFHYLGRQPTRFDRIARARNMYMRELESSDYETCSHVIVMDMDLVSYPSLSSVISCFERDDWDCVSSNGRQAHSGIYYDTFAFRDANIPLGPEICGPNWWRENKTIQQAVQGPAKSWKAVFSAFGGLAIYRKAAIQGLRYSGFITPEMLIDAKKLILENEQAKNLLTKTTGYSYVVLRHPIVFHNEYSVPGSCCEHVVLHHQMIKNGHSRIFINRELLTSWISDQNINKN